ncbi:MAG: serine/threonine-protein kinase [Clostridiales bacterium]|jgi:serine/threonine protein kinase|nr:serine/threonine-protein kinase [Clostridiales bacterium]
MDSGELFKIGFQMPVAAGQKCVVEKFLGAGGQGEVYQVKVGAESYALKWYFKQNQKKDLKESLEKLVGIGPPCDNFLWPMYVVECKGQFGYIMGLRPSKYEKSQKLLDRKFSLSYTKAANACLQLADSFRKLHVKGLSYQDISWGNLFINPANGDILICDNDNVAPHGQSVAGIGGTYGFMAPEVVRGDKRPDTYTDLFSLAALMFQMLFLEHPLNGRRWANIACWDDIAKKKLYGTDPIFIFDPNNKTNRPEPGVQDNANIFWRMYPSYIRDGFTKVFTLGLTDRENGRLMEEEWIDAFRRLKESLFPCPYCGRDIIYDHDEYIKTGGLTCWGSKCARQLPIPPRLGIKTGKRERYVVLNTDTKIYTYQLKPHEYDEGGKPAGEMAQSPNDPKKWGLRNLTAGNWHYTSGGTTKDVTPGSAFVLSRGVSIDFNSAQGEIII